MSDAILVLQKQILNILEWIFASVFQRLRVFFFLFFPFPQFGKNLGDYVFENYFFLIPHSLVPKHCGKLRSLSHLYYHPRCSSNWWETSLTLMVELLSFIPTIAGL